MTFFNCLIAGGRQARRMFSASLLALVFAHGPALAQTAGSPEVVSNGSTVGPMSGSAQSARYYALSIPAGTTGASFAITGNSGDADLYVRFGSVPTTSQWDQRPYLNSSNETVTLANPRVGTWYVMVRGYSAYSGLTLRVQTTGGAGQPGVTAATPVFTPAPGSYSGQANVALASSTPNAVIRYTLNGSAPTTGSEVYIAPIVVTTTTQVRAAAFATGLNTSPIASGLFTITNTIQTLSNNTPISNQSNTQGSIRNFKFAVPSGMTTLTIAITGGSGDADLYVKYGQLATTSVWDQRPYLGTSNETVTISAPRAGDYYVMINGYSAYSGLTIRASYSGTATAGKPELSVDPAAFNPFITTQTFGPNDCEIEEGTITVGTKKLLRFTTRSRNLGTADLVLGNPANSALFEFGACHGHYHFRSFAEYRLLDQTCGLVRTGKKVGFCLMDITRINAGANPSARYNCSNQGIQAGWADIYSANLSGQWIDITGLPAGNYILEVTIDPLNIIDELDETNNTARVNVTIPR
jgi:hypothetical protein